MSKFDWYLTQFNAIGASILVAVMAMIGYVLFLILAYHFESRSMVWDRECRLTMNSIAICGETEIEVSFDSSRLRKYIERQIGGVQLPIRCKYYETKYSGKSWSDCEVM